MLAEERAVEAPGWLAGAGFAAGPGLGTPARFSVPGSEHRANSGPPSEASCRYSAASGLSFAAGGPRSQERSAPPSASLRRVVVRPGRLPPAPAASRPGSPGRSRPPGPARCRSARRSALPNRSACGLPASTSLETSAARSHVRPPAVGLASFKSIAVRSQAWLPSRGPINSETRSPVRTARLFDRADLHALAPGRHAGGEPLPGRCRAAARATRSRRCRTRDGRA